MHAAKAHRESKHAALLAVPFDFIGTVTDVTNAHCKRAACHTTNANSLVKALICPATRVIGYYIGRELLAARDTDIVKAIDGSDEHAVRRPS